MKKALSLTLCLFIACTTLAGCDGAIKTGSSSALTNQELAKSSYPIDTDEVLSVWRGSGSTEFSQTPLGKELEKRTGVKIKCISPTSSSDSAQQFNLLLASGELPDIMEYKWYDVPGGPDKAIENGYITRLNELIDGYAPNYRKILTENEVYRKRFTTDTGNCIMFPFINAVDENGVMPVSSGFMIRQDWLDELGLETPETIEEWYNVLKAFKEKKGASAPLCIKAESIFSGLSEAYNIKNEFYVDDGAVKYSKYSPQYKELLKTIKKWYDEKLLDNASVSLDQKVIDSNIINGNTGITWGWIGANLGSYIVTMRSKNKNFKLSALPVPSLVKGEKPKMGHAVALTGFGSAISADSTKKELAAKYLDYGYSKEGIMLYNFGIEGESYTIVNGEPVYTDVILNNPNGLSINEAMSMYITAHQNPISVQDIRYRNQYYQLEEQKQASKVWSSIDGSKYIIPLVTHTVEESSSLAKTMSDVKSYADSMYLKFITGVESIDNFDKYMEQMKSLGIEKAIETKQNAYNRYNNK